MRQSFEIDGRLDGLNEYTAACRSNPYKGAAMKKRNEAAVLAAIRAARLQPMQTPIHVHITWIEGLKPGAKHFRPRDRDNIRTGAKWLLDSLTAAGIIDDDGWHKVSLSDSYYLNREHPRVIVELITLDTTEY